MTEQQQQRTSTAIKDEFLTEDISVGWPWRLLLFSVFIFVFSIFVYFGLEFGYKPYLESRIGEVGVEFEKLTELIGFEEQERFVAFYSQLVNLKSALDSHVFSSNAFNFLERYTINSVYFTGARQETDVRLLSLNGFAENFDALAEQMAVFDGLPEIERLVLINVGIRGDETSFAMEINWDEKFFKRLTQY